MRAGSIHRCAGLRFLALAVLLVALGGCASVVPRGGDEADAALKRFATRPDVAEVYIYCNQWMGVLPQSNIAVDGRPLGQLGSRTYLHAELPPGAHRITAAAGNTDSLDLEVEAGHDYFVWHEVKAGLLYPGAVLHLVPEPQGRAGVQSTRLAASTYREEDLRVVKAKIVGAAFLVNVLGALVFPAAAGPAFPMP